MIALVIALVIALMGARSGAEGIVSRASCDWPRAIGLLTLFVLLFVCQAQAVQQQSSKIPANFQQVETLVQQGRLEEAETKMREELQRNPGVDGYNLLGIIESEKQDYPNALAAFQQALQLSPQLGQNSQ